MNTRIKTKDIFGNVHYLYSVPGGFWRAALANGIPYDFGQAAHTKDAMALQFALEKAKSDVDALATFYVHSAWSAAEFELV